MASGLISDIIHARMTGRLGDLLLLFLDAGISYGSGLPLEMPADAITRELLETTIERWHRESRAMQTLHDLENDPQLLPGEIPAWLLALPNQKEVAHEAG